ncbi:MAG: trigger factor [Lachnospiraceae bacterium]|nr:trigger factor [Lachnospiraceae bacterium]
MSVQVEQLEGNKAKMTIEVEADLVKKALDRAYNKQKSRISVPGFRKGKAPRKFLEKYYGQDLFYGDAADILIDDAYPKAYDEVELDIVSRPECDIVQLEEGKPFIFTAEVELKPPVTLGEYKGIEVKYVDIEVTDADVDAEVERERAVNGRIVTVDEPAQSGDTVDINYEGFSDGKAFDGGKAEGHKLILGSHSFIDTFEDQLIGKSAGDEVDVNVTFPEEYHAPDLAGKPALFKVKVNGVERRELPEVDDDYVQEISEFDTVDEYRADIRERLEKRKKDAARRAQEDEALEKLADACEVEISKGMLELQTNNMINEYANQVMGNGIGFSQYMQMTGMTIDKLREQMEPDAKARTKVSLCLEEIAKQEGLEVTDADVDAKIKEMADRYQMNADEMKKNMADGEMSSFKEQILMEKAIDVVMDAVKVVKE